MATILVPTDFSDNAANALNYAISLAKTQKAKLVLFHSFLVNYDEVEYPEETLAEMKEDTCKQLRSLGSKIAKTGLEYDYYCAEGPTVKSILETIKEKKINMVIMGTKGESDLGSVMFGSNTAEVINKAECPVIAVPEGAFFKLPRKITYATNYNNSDLTILEELVSIAKPFRAQVNVIHIAEKDEPVITEKEHMEKFMKMVLEKINYNNISFQILSSDDVEQELIDYIEAGSTDILAMATHKRGFLEKLFRISLPNEMAYLSKIPLITFHYRKVSVNVFA